MRCEEVRLYVHAFHDGALTADRAVVIVEHVKGCDACRAIYDAEFKLRESARQAYERMVVPERLRGRLLRTLSRSRIRRRLAGALAAAGLLAAAGGAAAWRMGRRPAPDSFVQAALALAQAPVSDALMLGTSDDAAARPISAIGARGPAFTISPGSGTSTGPEASCGIRPRESGPAGPSRSPPTGAGSPMWACRKACGGRARGSLPGGYGGSNGTGGPWSW